jgi:sulfoxide reductase heme-binding subunit YedZ
MRLRKFVQFCSYYVLPVALLLKLFFDLFMGSDVYGSVVWYGNAAFFLLVVSLFVSPLSALLSLRFLRVLKSYRRELGLAIFWFAIFHGVTLLFYLGVFSDLFNPSLSYFYGLLGLIGILVLGFTSNRLSRVKLGPRWKKLHYLVYLVFFSVVIHKSMAEGESGPYVLLGVFVILKIAQLVRDSKNRLS